MKRKIFFLTALLAASALVTFGQQIATQLSVEGSGDVALVNDLTVYMTRGLEKNERVKLVPTGGQYEIKITAKRSTFSDSYIFLGLIVKRVEVKGGNGKTTFAGDLQSTYLNDGLRRVIGRSCDDVLAEFDRIVNP